MHLHRRPFYIPLHREKNTGPIEREIKHVSFFINKTLTFHILIASAKNVY